MSSIFRKAVVGILVVQLAACTKNFTAINTDPNTSTSVNPQYLLSSVLINSAYTYQSDAYMGKPAEAARYITKVRNEGDDLFGWSSVDWDSYYKILSVNKQLYNLSSQRGLKQYMAISAIMRVFNFAYITDLYGDCPYSEALRSADSSIVHPRYDPQETIYPGLLKTLADANTMLAGNTQQIDATYDVVFGGDALKWRKFANALRLRLLLRSAAHYSQAFADMQTMMNDPSTYPLFERNADNAELKYIGVTSKDSWPGGLLNNSVTEVNKYKPSKEIVDSLLKKNDPRLMVWIAPVAQSTGALVDTNKYVGVPNAIPSPYDYNGGEAHISAMAPIFYQNANALLKASMMTYTEQCFILAEAVQQGKITVPGETAASLYYKGIGASLDYYGIADNARKNYLQQAAVQYNGTLTQLITQKWIALFLKGAEGWFDHRRTGLPVFKTGPLAATANIPSRYIYPQTEQAYNLDQYKAAVARQGADATATLMWYLK